MTDTHTVLVVDDERDALMVALKILKQLDNLAIISAPNGEKALELAFAKNPDTILLDWNMPGLSGMEVLGKLKSNELTRDIPVIMATGNTASEDLQQALELGASDYIKKPIDKVELLSRMRASLTSYSYLKQIKNQHARLSSLRAELEQTNAKLLSSEVSLSELSHFKDNLFSVLSEDLKNPCYSLGEFLDVLSENINTFSNEQVNEIAVKITDSLNQANELLNNLLQWSKAQLQGIRPNPETFGLDALAQHVAVQVGHLVKHRAISIHVDVLSGAIVKADREHVEFIIRNVLYQAAVSAVNGTSILVKFCGKDDERASLCITGPAKAFPTEVMAEIEKGLHQKGTIQQAQRAAIGLSVSLELAKANLVDVSFSLKPDQKASQCKITFPIQ